MISQYTKLAKVEPIADVGFDFFAKAALYKSEKIQQTKGLLQSTLAGFTNTVDILKEPDRQYFNEKVKNVVDNLNSYKDVDLSDPNTVYQLQSMLGEVKQDKKIADDIISTANFRNVQKEQNLMMSNPKFKDLFHPLLYQADQKKMQKYLNDPGGKYTQQHASVNPNIEKQLEDGFKGINERKELGIEGENIVIRNVKDQGMLYQNGQDIVRKNVDFYVNTFDVKFDLENNPTQARGDINGLLSTQERYYKNKKAELEMSKSVSSNPNIFNDTILQHEAEIKKIQESKRIISEGSDLEMIKNIGLNAYMENTAFQQASRGYSYISDTRITDSAKLKAQLQNQLIIADYRLKGEAILNENTFQNNLKRDKINNEVEIAKANISASGKGSSKSDSSPFTATGTDIGKTVISEEADKNVNFYEQNKKERDTLGKDMLGLQKDMVKLLIEQSSVNPKVKQLLQTYPDLGSKLYGEQSLRNILITANMLSSLSGDKLEDNSPALGIMSIMNKIKEKNILYTLNLERDKDILKVSGNNPENYNKTFNDLYGSRTSKREITLSEFNLEDKDKKELRARLIPDLMSGAIKRKDGGTFDTSLFGTNEGDVIKNKIDWSKSEIRNYNVEKQTVEVLAKTAEGNTLNNNETVFVQVTPDFALKLRGMGYGETIDNINKPNTAIDYYVKQEKNRDYVKVLQNRPFYAERDKVPNLPKGTVLEYKIKDVLDPVPSAGDYRKDWTYVVELNIKGKPYSFNVNSTNEIYARLEVIANDSKSRAEKEFTAKNVRPSAVEFEKRKHEIFVEMLQKIK